MGSERLQSAVPDGEALRYTGTLRRGGSVGLTDERLLVLRGDDEEPTSVELGGIEAVELQDFDWYLAVLSVLLVGFGVVSLDRNTLAGVGFALLGVGSLYLTYRKRERAIVRVHSRAKPLTLYPADASDFYEAFQGRLDEFKARLDDADAKDGDGEPGAGSHAAEPE